MANVLTHLDRWKKAGAISVAQYEDLASLVRKDRFSIFIELNLLLYLGVLSLVGGVGWTVATYSARLGDVAILSALTAVVGWSLSYCFTRARAYSGRRVEPPSLAFDYVLYLGCLIFSVELGYVESRFHPFGPDWDHSLLLASAVFAVLAYRFDNRLVLSLALSTLGAWFGVRVSRFGLLVGGSLRPYALIYGGLVAVTGTALHYADIKRHFLETYFHIASNVLFIALLSGVVGRGGASLVFLMALLGLSALTIVQGVRFGRFAFVVYGIVYGYLGISVQLLRDFRSFSAIMAYFVVSGTMVILALVGLARRFGREE